MKLWDIFCRVVDNFGDIGVCWRLARQLTAEHGIDVRLWVDDLASLQQICPEVDSQIETQRWDNIEIRHWPKQFPEVMPADVIIEAFGCGLPENYLAAMSTPTPKPPHPSPEDAINPVWINLEYLSAETWVESCHTLPSPHPHLPLTKYFFFPGFTPATGGLLRETDLLARRDDLQQASSEIWQLLRLPQPAANEITISLFCYDTAPIANLLNAWQNASTPVRCLMPESKALAQVATHFEQPNLVSGDSIRHGNLTLHILPFLRQEDYDPLLWACDCNFVRGEDSFVRAQLAGKPMVWQIYVQEEKAHLAKLDAFLDRYCAGMDTQIADIVRAFHHGWNGHGPLEWNDFLQYRTALERHARMWAAQLATQVDLASNLVIFCKNRV